MKLNQSGQAFFVLETEEKPDLDTLEQDMISEDEEDDDLLSLKSDEDIQGTGEDVTFSDWSYGVGSTSEISYLDYSNSPSVSPPEDSIIESLMSTPTKPKSISNSNRSERSQSTSWTSWLSPYGSPVQPSPLDEDSPLDQKSKDFETPKSSRWRNWLTWSKKKEDYVEYDLNNQSRSLPEEPFLKEKPLPEVSALKERTVFYYRSLRPSSEQLKMLKLKKGVNKATFVVNDRYLQCNIFLWDSSTKIVVTDIDGTITKSDVLGHIYSAFGKDWAQPGVTSLFSNIKANGYEVIYLTSRSIGINARTKHYLQSLVQDNKKLPLGPVLLSPDRLLHALNRELIVKSPHVFKIGCLKDVQKLFPKDSNPIYAGFGNQQSDFRSYKEIGIPLSRIFTINSLGEISFFGNSNTTSYGKIDVLVEHIFPPTTKIDKEKWNDFQFWESRPQFSLEDIEKELAGM